MGDVDISNLSICSEFITKHWKGYYPLYFSFWVNFTLIFLIYNGFEFLVRNYFWQVFVGLPLLISYLVLTRLVIFPWQIVGLLRTCEKHFLEHGAALQIRSIQGLVIVAIIMNTVGAIDILQWYMQRQKQATEAAKISKTKNYSLSLSENATLIYLNGTLDFGITGDMEAILTKNSNIKAVVLSSTGGIVSEGRGIFRLIDQYNLDTFVYEECSSACALAFVAGSKRYIAANAKLGFHQYNLQLKNPYQHLDVNEAQQQDLELLRKKHISENFLEQVFEQPSHLIWFPTVNELLDSRVINALVEQQRESHLEDKTNPSK